MGSINLDDIRKTHKALKSSEEKYSTLVERGDDGIIIIQDGLLKFANHKMTEFTGCTKEDLIGTPLLEYIPPEYKEIVWERYEKKLNNDNSVPRKYELELLSRYGVRIPVEMNASLIEHEGNSALMAIIRDITDRKRSEESLRKYAYELSKLNDELKSLAVMKDEFLSNVGHELKTPLVSIKGYSELLVDGKLGDVTKQQKMAVDKVLKNSERLERLVDSLLYVSMVQTGNVEYSFENVKLDKILDQTVKEMFDRIESKNLKFERNIPSELSSINGDKDKLLAMLMNIFDNAIKFTPHGGNISLHASEYDNHLYVGVKDDGIGIPEEVMPNLFQSFYQVDASSTRTFGGTGLGLYICKNIIDAHDGEIWLESGEGIGTTVHLKLPK